MSRVDVSLVSLSFSGTEKSGSGHIYKSRNWDVASLIGRRVRSVFTPSWLKAARGPLIGRCCRKAEPRRPLAAWDHAWHSPLSVCVRACVRPRAHMIIKGEKKIIIKASNRLTCFVFLFICWRRGTRPRGTKCTTSSSRCTKTDRYRSGPRRHLVVEFGCCRLHWF